MKAAVNFGIEKSNVEAFDVLDYLLNPPWRSEYKGEGDQPLWRTATIPDGLPTKCGGPSRSLPWKKSWPA